MAVKWLWCGFCLQCFDTIGRQDDHPACKNWVMRCGHGYLSGASCKWFAYGPADVTATRSSFASLKSSMVSPFWCRLIQAVLAKRGHQTGVCLSVCLVMTTLCNRAGHYICALWFLLLLLSFFFFLFFPRVILAVTDWMSTILPHMVSP